MLDVEEILEAATVGEEVALAEETVVPAVDLSTVSQQLDMVILWQKGQLGFQALFLGCFLGAVIAVLIGRWWR